MVDSQSHEDYRDVVSRRKFVALTGAAGAAAVAGCLDGDDGGNGTGPGNGTGNGDGLPDGAEPEPPEKVVDNYDDQDQWFSTGNWSDPTAVQFNPFNAANLGGQFENALWEEFANYHLALQEWMPHAVTEWDITDDAVTLQLRDDLVWSDGEDVTAEDVVTSMRLGEYQDAEVWDFAESVEASGDHEVTINLQEPSNEDVLEWVVLTDVINAPAHVYGEYLDSIEGGDDPDDVMGELAGISDRDPVTCAPFQFNDDASTNEYMQAEAFDDHPDADNVNFNGYRMYQRGSNEAYTSSLSGGEFDGLLSLFVPTGIVQTFPDFIDEVRIPGTFGVGLVFNHDVSPVDDRRVRQAIGFATNMQLAADNADPQSKDVPAVPAGITSAYVEDYLGDDIDAFETYEPDYARAGELLEEAGYTRNPSNNLWEDDSGDPISFTVNYPAGWSDWVSAIETVASQLNQFGFDVSLEGIPRGTLQENLSNGDFEVSGWEWNEGAKQFNHPYFSLRHSLLNRQLDGSSSFFNYPGDTEEIEVPAMDGDGTISVDIPARFEDLATANDPDEAHDILVELAWVVNQDLPMMPIQDKYEQSFLTNDDWDYPDPNGDDTWHYSQLLWPLYWLPKRGHLAASG